MAAALPPAEQVPSVDPHTKDESDPKVEAKETVQSDPTSATADDAKPIAQKAEAVTYPSIDSVPGADVEPIPGQPRHDDDDDDDGNLTFSDLQAAVSEMDENLDDAFGQAADTFWNFASAVTGKVSSVVKDQHSLENLRKKVTSRLSPLGAISRDIQTQIGTLAPDEKSISSIAGSVKSVAETVQRNAVAMEEAILATANSAGDSNAGPTVALRSADLTVNDPGVAVLPEMKASDGLDEIAAAGEKVSSALEQTVGGLWSGLWGGDEEEGMEQTKDNVPKTRFGKRVFELQANPDTYCEPAEDLDAFEKWGNDFNLDKYEQECMDLLYTHDSIAELYERVVPRVVEENTFWMRYFFAKYNLEMDEKRRQKLLERAENAVEGADEEDGGWGDDDWDDETQEEEDGDTLPTKESSTEGSSHDVNRVEASAAASETPEPQSKESLRQKVLDTGSDGPQHPATKGDSIPKGTKEQGWNKAEKPTGLADVQDADDDWGGDDWE